MIDREPWEIPIAYNDEPEPPAEPPLVAEAATDINSDDMDEDFDRQADETDNTQFNEE